jgi:outer membrane protein
MKLSFRRVVVPFAVFVALFLGTANLALAQVKIAVVDLQLAIASTKEGKSAKAKLEKMTEKKQKELDERVNKIKKMEEDMEKQLPLMSDEGKKDMMEKYKKEMAALQELYMTNQSDLAKRKKDLLEPILQKMGAIIQDLALSEGYTLILDKGDGAVLYFQPSLDLTSEVISLYNKK